MTDKPKQIPPCGKLPCDVRALNTDNGREVVLKTGTAYTIHEHHNWVGGQRVIFSSGPDMITARTEDFLYGE